MASSPTSLSTELGTLLSLTPPPFIYIRSDLSRVSSEIVLGVLRQLEGRGEPPRTDTKFHFAHIDAIVSFTPRLLYDNILNALAGWEPIWAADDCLNWNTGDGTNRWNESIDGFFHGLQVLNQVLRDEKIDVVESGRDGDHAPSIQHRLVIFIDRAERLRETAPDLLVPFARLAELTKLDVCVIFNTGVRWEEIRPLLGASPDPYFMDMGYLSKEESAKLLVAQFPPSSDEALRVGQTPLQPYHRSLRSLWVHYIAIICDVCYPFTHDPEELAYIASARWPGFVQPLLDERRQIFQQRAGHDFDAQDQDDLLCLQEISLEPLTDEVRLRLSRLFGTSITSAVEELYPRAVNAGEWASLNQPESDILSKHPSQIAPFRSRAQVQIAASGTDIKALPRLSKFILVASFLASTNPAKSDLRMFGRGLDEKKRRRRRVTKASSKVKSGPLKMPQRLSGPMPFPLDRLIAVLGALLEENDADSRPRRPEHTIPGEYTDMEISRIGIHSSVVDLCETKLLHRTSPNDRLDGPPMFKCAVSYELILSLARQLQIPLTDLMWDPL